MKAWLVQLLGVIALFTWVNLAQEIPLVKGSAVASATLEIEPLKLDFGSRSVGTLSDPITTAIKNTGSAPVKILDITASGIDFNQTNTCTDDIMPGSACEIQVTFKPVITGTRLGVLSVMVSSPGKPYYVGLTGVGQ